VGPSIVGVSSGGLGYPESQPRTESWASNGNARAAFSGLRFGFPTMTVEVFRPSRGVSTINGRGSCGRFSADATPAETAIATSTTGRPTPVPARPYSRYAPQNQPTPSAPSGGSTQYIERSHLLPPPPLCNVTPCATGPWRVAPARTCVTNRGRWPPATLATTSARTRGEGSAAISTARPESISAWRARTDGGQRRQNPRTKGADEPRRDKQAKPDQQGRPRYQPKTTADVSSYPRTAERADSQPLLCSMRREISSVRSRRIVTAPPDPA